MQQTISSVQNLLQDRDTVYYRWTVAPTPDHVYSRLDRTYLNVLYRDSEGIGRFMRILGYREKTGTPEEFIWFKPGLCRIKNGPRRGRVMAVEHVEEDEKVKPAGISKQLTVQDKPWAFTERRTGDVEIVDLLEDLANSTMVPEPERMFVPSFYLVTRQRKHTVQVRDTPEALRYLQERDGYDSRLTPSENTQKSGKRIAQVLPKGRLAWPYQYFCAAGVAVSDLVVSGWLKGRKENCSVNEPTWRIDIFSEEQHGKEPDIS